MSRPQPDITATATARMLAQAIDRVGLRAHHTIGLSCDEAERRAAYAAAARAEADMLRALAAELEARYAMENAT